MDELGPGGSHPSRPQRGGDLQAAGVLPHLAVCAPGGAVEKLQEEALPPWGCFPRNLVS